MFGRRFIHKQRGELSEQDKKREALIKLDHALERVKPAEDVLEYEWGFTDGTDKKLIQLSDSIGAKITTVSHEPNVGMFLLVSKYVKDLFPQVYLTMNNERERVVNCNGFK